mgnify:CR=1 FL=1
MVCITSAKIALLNTSKRNTETILINTKQEASNTRQSSKQWSTNWRINRVQIAEIDSRLFAWTSIMWTERSVPMFVLSRSMVLKKRLLMNWKSVSWYVPTVTEYGRRTDGKLNSISVLCLNSNGDVCICFHDGVKDYVKYYVEYCVFLCGWLALSESVCLLCYNNSRLCRKIQP